MDFLRTFRGLWLSLPDMNAKNSRVTAWARAVLGLVMLLVLSGCVGAPYWGGSSKHPAAGQYADGRAHPGRR